MPVINILSPHVADMIAAGEVVERPASVIKELMENAFDAGAKNITVEIRGGGATYIRVTDDGVGMSPEDAGVAFLRHATSKLKNEHDLEAISTMGFRGEALAAISAVSRIELSTRQRSANEGTRVTLDAGDIQEMTPCGCPVGTTMTVRDLFYNTPARLKFLKSDRSESAACVTTALRCALGRPEVSVRFIKDGSEEFFSPGDGRLDSCIYTLLGRDIATTLLEVKSADDDLAVRGFTSSPSAGRGNRTAQYFFCNGRYIRSALLQTAVEQAYKNTLLTGRYPACVLYLDMSCASVDVNVHPAKTEVKFSYEKRIFDLVYHAVLLALEGESRTAAVELSPGTQRLAQQARGESRAVSAPNGEHITQSAGAYREAPAKSTAPAAAYSGTPKAREDFYRHMTAEQFRANGYSVKSTAKSEPASAPKEYSTSFDNNILTLRTPDTPYQTRIDLSNTSNSTNFASKSPVKTEYSPNFNNNIVENSVHNVDISPIPEYRLVGEALKTYIIVELDGELILIDKHAAHERMIFDRLKAEKREIMSQQLLTPVTIRLNGEDAELLEQNGELLSQLGFELEVFGEEEYILRAVPADMLAGDARAAIEEICEKLRRGRTLSAASARDEILHTVACKAAIKAGWNTDEKELRRVVDAVVSGQVKYCPHGRPVSVTVTRKELDKLFKRIV